MACKAINQEGVIGKNKCPPELIISICLPAAIWILAQYISLSLDLSNIEKVVQGEKVVSLSLRGIYINNVIVINKNLSGVFTFGVTSLINIFMTSFLVGLHINSLWHNGYSFFFILKLVLPQFTEYIALWISSSLGLLLGIKIWKKSSKFNWCLYFKLYVLTYPLLLFASFMEVNFAKP